MADDTAPNGKRFTHVYTDRTVRHQDSAKARVRCFQLLDRINGSNNLVRNLVVEAIPGEIGVELWGWAGVEEFFKKAKLPELLDAITVISDVMGRNGREVARRTWIVETRRIFAEELLAYRLDDAGGVHHLVDAEFDSNTRSAIGALDAAKYKAARIAFEDALAALVDRPQDTKHAIRNAFGSVEIMFRMICERAPRLGAAELRQHLAPVVQKRFAADPIAQASSAKVLASLSDWADAAHHYRHEPGQPDPATAPMDLAVLLVSNAAGFLRWLAELDKADSKGAAAKAR
jgi:hypothetical protein